MSTTEEKMFVPKDGKATTIRFVDDPSFHHIRPQSFGGPGTGIKIPATKETEAFFEKEMAKAQHNKMVMDRHGLKPEDMFDEEKNEKTRHHDCTEYLNFAIFQLAIVRHVV